MPQATVLISFDCEAKWGVADWITDRENHFFTNAQLNQTYQRITELLSRYGIKATFAFVGALALSEEAYQEQKEEFFLHLTNEDVKKWFTRFKCDAERGQFDGWLNPELLTIVSRHPEHEIAAHGFTHLPLGEAFMSRERFIHEMECLKKIPVFQRENLTLIYPRHVVGYTALLPEYGFIGYRKSLRGDATHPVVRCLNLVDAVNIFQSAQPHAEPEDLVQIPAGFVLNWRAGIRKHIPFNLTVLRWEHLLHHAITSQKVFHLWTHPHNFASGHRMFDLFESILQKISQAQKAGKIVNYTQAEYAQQYGSEFRLQAGGAC